MIKRDDFEDLIDNLVVLENCSSPDHLDRKIELLCFALEELKFERGGDAVEVSFEEYVQSDVRISGNRLLVSAPSKLLNVGSGMSPIQLQAPLLLFLLLNHKERYQVLDIIRLFIEQMRSQLSFLDFKKTRTGVTRCFTNTRFAAHVLRDYGLLKFTRREAFKTWELSLAGFLVAADVLNKRSKEKNPWHLHVPNKDANFDLLPEIRIACHEIHTFDVFVIRLASICKPDAELFKTFEPALKQAFDLLQGYWRLLSDRTKSQKERREASLERIKQLDALGDKFFQELSRCIQINDALRRILQHRGDA